ncbi:nucleotidyltransferase family protein [Brevibacterium album]|uniref:nucleotidyltransferase family protein n=1 Tax=Brevibacterium album TaxID=417948 RepID=UPI0003FB7589|nr:nucleotidyltransferase family protein [Brevibacterium album]
MAQWIAVSYGALDVSERSDFPGTELLVTPTVPGVPLALPAGGAELWRRLVEGPLDSAELDDDERTIVEEMRESGLASTDLQHPARQTSIPAPWLSSPLHELVYGLVASLAQHADIPLVFVKGPVLHAQGLRSREHSADVDAWVAPDRLAGLADALKPWGWGLMADVWEHSAINHSVTLVPQAGWGCEIDLHRRLPGLALSDQDAFAAVRARSEPVEFAGVGARAPERTANAVLSALHIIRPAIGKVVSSTAVPTAAEVLRTAGAEAVSASAALDATIALEEALTSAFPHARIDVSAAGRPRDWYPRTRPNKALAYWATLQEMPLRERPSIAFRLIWPSADVALASSENLGVPETSVARARLRRLWRGVREIGRTALGRAPAPPTDVER